MKNILAIKIITSTPFLEKLFADLFFNLFF